MLRRMPCILVVMLEIFFVMVCVVGSTYLTHYIMENYANKD
jgi:hypothetical protein